MNLRCNNPACLEVIDFKKGYDMYKRKYFCSDACSRAYAFQEQRFEQIASSRGQPPLNYARKKWYTR